MLDEITVVVESKHVNEFENSVVFTLGVLEEFTPPTLEPTTVRFIQTEDATELGIAVLPYGGIIFGGNVTLPDPVFQLVADIKGVKYTNDRVVLNPATAVGASFSLFRESAELPEAPQS